MARLMMDRIEAGRHGEPLTEIELEMKSGDPWVLYLVGINPQ
jgi:hypothetical protein